MIYGYIYLRRNKINNKCYIGQHKYPKFEIDPKYVGSGKLFRIALNKYGEDNFTYELLDYAESYEELNEKEEYWVEHYNTLVPNGYNLRGGGNGPKFSIETRQKISLAIKHCWENEEYRKSIRKNMSDAHKGVPSGMLGKKLTEEQLKTWSKVQIGRTWYNNGIREVTGYSCPEGFVKGRLPVKESVKQKFSKLSKGRIWVNNGVQEKFILPEELDDYLQKNYVRGRLKKK